LEEKISTEHCFLPPLLPACDLPESSFSNKPDLGPVLLDLPLPRCPLGGVFSDFVF
jgi:hypothetical protein